MAGLKDQLNADLRDAMRAKDIVRRGTLRLLLSSIHNAEIEARKPLDEVEVLNVLNREIKQRRESIEEYGKANRQDLVQSEQAELNVLLEYQPPQLSEAEITELANQIILRTGAVGLKDKGRVMPVIMAELRGKADGSTINRIVTELLGQA